MAAWPLVSSRAAWYVQEKHVSARVLGYSGAWVGVYPGARHGGDGRGVVWCDQAGLHRHDMTRTVGLRYLPGWVCAGWVGGEVGGRCFPYCQENGE